LGQLIFEKITKIVATRSHLSKLKCTKFDFGWGSVPDSAGVLSALRQTPSWILGVILLKERTGGEQEERERKRSKRERGKKGRDKRGKGRVGKGDDRGPLIILTTPLLSML